ncbi:aminomethyl-transferring glycine dehydrogenase subunit GcvPB [Telmatospirillum siberiense]|uniref:glycine dehydrogenase (aminomethyl-transferring) n=1 Tax=Telmatospirillum siberiense TaxID=382514 RepID=A0A2N3PTM5_9PROT|nr:aminomethyl-transferring glycine dehydrogenase subunit GcvPB [Telmatospirillum siberiense]PKU23754.1 glycine dehydrogenase (aminomethyl-transferring) [Telmatospirillum siberiense]
MSGDIGASRGMFLEEPLIFEQDTPGRCGVDLPEPEPFDDRLGGARRQGAIGLPDLSEPAVVRHYTRLSQKNFGIDTVFYPLGSCTMKHNPRLGEKMARLPGLSDIHPFQPESTVQGALELIDLTAHWLKTLTGMPAIVMSPAAGAHGEFCGLMTIRTALEDRGERRTRVLVPESAHGTNPASAAACGFAVDAIPATAEGRVDLAALKAKLGLDVAAVMLTNPNTCGLFERDILEIAEAIHAVGGYFYCDGANYNAIVGRVRIVDLGIDVMHINLHKTFSTPHGGGGPGAGPTVLSAALAPFAPLPAVVHDDKGFRLIEHAAGSGAKPCGRIKGYHGQFGVFVRALSYMMSMGADGLRQASSDAVLNANYLLAELSDELSPSFAGPCMHEALFDDRFLKDSGVTTLDFAKALIDEGFHPMTMYFPLVVHGALLMEPTETEGKNTLDQFIAVVRDLARRAKAGESEAFKAAPVHTPRRRLDETAAARTPILRWRPVEA